jgi:hypothetical protein
VEGKIETWCRILTPVELCDSVIFEHAINDVDVVSIFSYSRRPREDDSPRLRNWQRNRMRKTLGKVS